MALKEAFIIKVPGVDPKSHRSEMILPQYELYTVLVNGYDEAVEAAKELAENKGVHGIILCAGFSNEEVGNMSSTLSDNVGVLVVRGDSRSSNIISEAIKSSNW